MPKKQNRPTKPRNSQNNKSDSETPLHAGPVVQVVESDDFHDRFAALFETGDNGNVLVSLRRISPETMLDPATSQEIGISGFLLNLPPDLNSYEEFIQRKFGGGIYQADKREKNDSGRWVFGGGVRVTISGRPKVPDDVQSVTSGAPGAAPVANVGNHEGINLDGSDAAFDKRIERILLLKAATREPDGLTTKDIINLFSKRPEPVRGESALDTIKTLAAAMEIVKDITPDNNIDQGWPGLIKEALATVGKMADDQRETGKSPRAGHVVKSENDGGEDGLKMADVKTQAAHATVNVVESFFMNPRKPVDRVVRMLDVVLEMPKSVRAGLKDKKELLFDLADVQLGERLTEDDDEAKVRGEFREYFDEVFDKFTDVERQVASI